MATAIDAKTLVDLHIHSYASDGTATPRQIVDIAKKKHIGLISLTDHNSIENQCETAKLAKANGIAYISGAEVDCRQDGVVYHVLAYGFDIENKRFTQFLHENRNRMLTNNRRLIARMSKDYSQLDITEYDAWEYEPTLGGWKAINYLVAKGITELPKQGLPFYAQYDCPITNVELPPMRDVIGEIHSAGGVAVLAHPEGYYDFEPPGEDEITAMLGRATAQGIQGVECYYFAQSEQTTKTCIDWCTAHDLMITAGCDYHGGFIPHTAIGSMPVTYDMLDLRELETKIVR